MSLSYFFFFLLVVTSLGVLSPLIACVPFFFLSSACSDLLLISDLASFGVLLAAVEVVAEAFLDEAANLGVLSSACCAFKSLEKTIRLPAKMIVKMCFVMAILIELQLK